MSQSDYSHDALQYSPPARLGTTKKDYLASIGKKNNAWNRFFFANGSDFSTWRDDRASQNQFNQDAYAAEWQARLNSPAVQRELNEQAGSNMFWNGQGGFSAPNAGASQEYMSDVKQPLISDIAGQLFQFVSAMQDLRMKNTQIRRGEIENRILAGSEPYKIASAREALNRLFLGNNKEYFQQFGDDGDPLSLHPIDARHNGYISPLPGSFFRDFLAARLKGETLQNTGRSVQNERLTLANAFYRAMYTDEYANTLHEYQNFKNAVAGLSASQADKLQGHLQDWINMVVKGYELNTKKMTQAIKFLGTDKAIEIVRGFTGIASDLVGMFAGGEAKAIGSLIEDIDPTTGEVFGAKRKTNIYE